MKTRKTMKTKLLMKLSPVALMVAFSVPAQAQPLVEKNSDRPTVAVDNTYVHSSKVAHELNPKDEVVADVVKDKDEVVAKKTEEKNETVVGMPTPEEIILQDEIAEKEAEIEKLNTDIAKVKIESDDASKEIERLTALVEKREVEISTLQSRIADLEINVATHETVKTQLTEKADKLDSELVTAKEKIAELEKKIEEVEAENQQKQEELIASQERVKELEEKNSSLENAFCEQEDKIAKLETAIQSSSQDILGPLMMQQQMMMMNYMMTSGFPTTQAPSLASGTLELKMEMMLQSIRFENQISNMSNNMFGMMGLMTGITAGQAAPTYNIGGDYIGGNYALTTAAQVQQQAEQQALLQGTMAMTAGTPYAPNLNQDARNFGNMKEEKSIANKKNIESESKLKNVANEESKAVGLGKA